MREKRERRLLLKRSEPDTLACRSIAFISIRIGQQLKCCLNVRRERQRQGQIRIHGTALCCKIRIVRMEGVLRRSPTDYKNFEFGEPYRTVLRLLVEAGGNLSPANLDGDTPLRFLVLGTKSGVWFD